MKNMTKFFLCLVVLTIALAAGIAAFAQTPAAAPAPAAAAPPSLGRRG